MKGFITKWVPQGAAYSPFEKWSVPYLWSWHGWSNLGIEAKGLDCSSNLRKIFPIKKDPFPHWHESMIDQNQFVWHWGRSGKGEEKKKTWCIYNSPGIDKEYPNHCTKLWSFIQNGCNCRREGDHLGVANYVLLRNPRLNPRNLFWRNQFIPS